MKKPQILLLIPLAIVAIITLYSWGVILLGPIAASWQQYAASVFLILLAVLFIKRFKSAVIGTGIFLLLGTANLLVFTPSFRTDSLGVRLGSLEIYTPQIQPTSLVILIVYLVLNFDTLTEIYLDYQEDKKQKRI